MSRRLRWIAGVAGGLVLALALLFYTPPGLALVGRLAASLTGGQIQVAGLGGFFPGRLHVSRLEVADKNGVWLRIDQAALEWSALALIRNHVAIDRLSAARITVLRRPLPSEEADSGENPRIDIASLSAPDIALAAPVIGHPVSLSARGSLHFASLKDLAADLLVTRAASSDSYRVNGGIRNGVAYGSASIREATDGILGKLAGLPGLGAVNLSAQATGDARANIISLRLSAGQLTAEGHGTIALATSRAAIDINLNAAAMAPRPDLSWSALSGDLHLQGAFTAPRLRGHIVLKDGRVAGSTVEKLSLDATGDSGTVALQGVAERLAVPGDKGLLASTPLQFTAQAALKDPSRPIRLTVSHPLAQLQAVVQTAGMLHAAGDLTVPALAPFSTLAGTALAGDARLHATVDSQGKQTKVALDGAVRLTGSTLPARLLGRMQLALAANLEGTDITASRLSLQSVAAKVEAEGTLRAGRLNYRLGLDLTDLSRLAATLQGALTLKASVTGPLDRADLAGSGSALLATKGFARQRVTIELKAQGLPALSDASLVLGGQLNGAPLALNARLTGNKNRRLALAGHWRSLKADADLALAETGALDGRANLALNQLSDIAMFTGNRPSGAAHAAITFQGQRGRTGADVNATLTGFEMAQVGIQSATLKGRIGDLSGNPRAELMLAASRIRAQGWTGDARAQMEGPLDRLGIALDAGLTDPNGNRANVHGAATLDGAQQQLALTALTGDWRTFKLALEAPATVRFAGGLAVDRLAMRLGQGRVVLSGKLTPELALTATADNINLADYAVLAPDMGPQGLVSGTADLRGTLSAPMGRIALRGRGLHAGFSPGGMPHAGFILTAQLLGDHARLDSSLDAGTNAHLTMTGMVPLTAAGSLALHVAGKADLALLDALTAISGRRIRGTLTLEGDAAGPLSAPRISGRGSLADGEIQDYAQGVRIQEIAASFTSDGNRLSLTRLTGRAGPGTLSGSGAVDLTAPNMPVSMKLELQNARPVTSDLLTANLSGSLSLTGHVKTAMTLAGDVQVTQASINIPQSFPPAVAVLNVRHRGQPPPPPPARQSPINLDLRVRSTGPIFVRGHGVDADMGGGLRLGGTVGAPAVSGGFRLNRGTFSLAGQTLNFTSGQVRFDGSGLRGRLDPSLNFVAQTVSSGVTATLTITGYVSQPKIALTSTPSLPQDEVVAHLLFQQSVKQLTPLQLASIAQAAAEMGGIGGGFNPLGTVRKTLGLDRFSVGSVQGGASGTESQTTVEAGRYVARNVYVGVKQNLSGGTQTQVQVDITRRLKAQATLSAGAATTTVQGNALQDNGSSIGLSYQFQY